MLTSDRRLGSATRSRLLRYFDTLDSVARRIEATDGRGIRSSLDDAVADATAAARATHDAGNKLIFIGNGGSASISSHMAVDYSKNGRIRAVALNDAAVLTALANDFGYERVFAGQIEQHAQPGDLLVAISSSGTAPSVLHAVDAARNRNCRVFTFSGFSANNPLRARGDLNFYVPATEYAFVEISHLVVCHAILDLSMGWGTC